MKKAVSEHKIELDIGFKAPKVPLKGITLKKIILISATLAIFLLFFIAYKAVSSSPPIRLVPTPTPTAFPLSQLEMKNTEMKWFTRWRDVPTSLFFNGTITNNSQSLLATNIQVKIVFYKTKGGEPIDTQTVLLGLSVPAGETKFFEEPPFSFYNLPDFVRNNQFWWTAQIIGATAK